jgi:1,4-dihydroxy-2-naphthoate octaprenyltransferase
MLIVLLSAPLGYKAARGTVEHHDDVHKLVPSLAANVQWILISTLLTIIGLLASAWL